MVNSTFEIEFKEDKKYFPANRTVEIATCDEQNARKIAMSIYGKGIEIISIKISGVEK